MSNKKIFLSRLKYIVDYPKEIKQQNIENLQDSSTILLPEIPSHMKTREIASTLTHIQQIINELEFFKRERRRKYFENLIKKTANIMNEDLIDVDELKSYVLVGYSNNNERKMKENEKEKKNLLSFFDLLKEKEKKISIRYIKRLMRSRYKGKKIMLCLKIVFNKNENYNENDNEIRKNESDHEKSISKYNRYRQSSNSNEKMISVSMNNKSRTLKMNYNNHISSIGNQSNTVPNKFLFNTINKQTNQSSQLYIDNKTNANTSIVNTYNASNKGIFHTSKEQKPEIFMKKNYFLIQKIEKGNKSNEFKCYKCFNSVYSGIENTSNSSTMSKEKCFICNAIYHLKCLEFKSVLIKKSSFDSKSKAKPQQSIVLCIYCFKNSIDNKIISGSGCEIGNEVDGLDGEAGMFYINDYDLKCLSFKCFNFSEGVSKINSSFGVSNFLFMKTITEYMKNS